MLEIFYLVAFRTRVAVDALVLAAAVQVHVVIKPEPILRPFHTYQQGFSLYLFHNGCIQMTLKPGNVLFAQIVHHGKGTNCHEGENLSVQISNFAIFSLVWAGGGGVNIECSLITKNKKRLFFSSRPG